MIKGFQQFNEELKWSTYRDAQSKLRKLGHKERADKLLKHSYISENRDLGTFNAHIDISTMFSTNYMTKKKEWMFYVKNQGSELIPSKGDNPGEKLVEKVLYQFMFPLLLSWIQ